MSTDKRIRLDWLFYILMALGLIGLLIWSTMSEIARNPSREAVADLGPNGLVTVSLQTDPYPARPTGTVELSFMLMNSRRVTIEPDSFSFEYGREGNNQPVGSGTIQSMSDGSGVLMAGAQFPSVGTWWLRVNLAKDGYQDEVQFTIEVRPAQ
ncbi:MAG: hypothetical protein JNM55_09765 [Anaerolineales bacterium]|jgi:hypothetical protein|nr:hypothetical protein [Anaerolineales bacterium]